jgi:creatinine amidohydrolase
MAACPFDHAGQGETSLLMALCPEAVDLAFLSDKTCYARSARQSSLELGVRGRELILDQLRKALA